MTPLQGCQPASDAAAEDSLCSCIWPVFLLLAVQLSSCACLQSNSLLDKIKAAVEDNSAPLARQGALAVLTAVASNGSRVAEPYVVPLLDLVLERYADKVISSTLAPACACTCALLGGLTQTVGAALDLGHTPGAGRMSVWLESSACLSCCKVPAFGHICLCACFGRAVLLLDQPGHGAAACCLPSC